ncbi:MAG TPA: nucleotidyltransferase family protein, partial [Longimicrobiales bacterium]|nr:nucleotidyltransferase family protein [Longimicrobiales bacterium]
MKAIIPLAGKGTRLRPHTHRTPKPLLRVGGRPVMSYILDDLQAHGVEEIVFIVGYLGDAIRDYLDAEYPEIRAQYVVQEVQDGTAGAVHLTRDYIDEEVLILFVDTIFEADLSL